MACLVSLGGLFALAGFWGGEPSRRLWGSSYVAWGARLCLGAVLFLRAADRRPGRGFVRVTLSLLVFTFGLVATFFPEEPGRAFYVPELTAVTLVCFSIAAVYLETRFEMAHTAVPWLALGGVTLNAVILLGYLYDALPLYGNESGSVGILSAATSIVIGAGLLAASGTHRFPLRMLTGETITARLLRAILPVTCCAMLLGEIISDGIRSFGVGERGVQDALQTFFATVFITGVVLVLARRVGQRLDRAERQRDDAETALSDFNASLAETVAQRTAELRFANRELRREIVGRNAIECALRESENKNLALLAALPDWIMRLRSDGTILDLRCPLEADGSGRELAPPPALISQIMERVTTNFAVTSTQSVHFRLSAEQLTFEARFVRSSESEWLVVMRDISEIARLESEVLEATAREQRRIGEELHDGIGQQLTALAFMSKLLELDLAEQNLPQAAQAGEIGRQVSASVGNLRSLARGLFRNELGSDSLVEALRELTASADKSFRIHCTLDADKSILLPDRVANLHLYRISQEAITNAVKHGNARRVHIELKRESTGIVFRIRDDGVGADFSAAMHDGIGLRTMEFRTRRLGGYLGVQSQPGQGTLITCTLPDLSVRPSSECEPTLQLPLFQ